MRPIELVPIDILGSLPKTKLRIQHVAIIAAQFSKLSRAITTAKMNSTKVVTILFDNWDMLYGISSHIMSECRPQFVCIFFTTLCTFLGINKFMTTAYHPQKNRQVE